MATMQVPGYVPANNDRLHQGCWAEQKDRAILINRLVGNDVSYAVKAMDGRLIEAPKTMKVLDFQKTFSDAGWLWHDKTPAPLAA